MALKVGCIKYLLFFSIWPCSLARSCRRCWCRSAAREGEPRGRQSSCRTALQRCWPALCCAPRNKRLAGYLMWCYNRYTWPSFLQRRRFRQHCSSFSWARWFSNDYLISLHNMNRLVPAHHLLSRVGILTLCAIWNFYLLLVAFQYTSLSNFQILIPGC